MGKVHTGFVPFIAIQFNMDLHPVVEGLRNCYPASCFGLQEENTRVNQTHLPIQIAPRQPNSTHIGIVGSDYWDGPPLTSPFPHLSGTGTHASARSQVDVEGCRSLLAHNLLNTIRLQCSVRSHFMDQLFSGTSTTYSWVILPMIIFFSRIIDVSLGTVRIVSIARGYKVQAAVTGFFEVLIWIVVISQIFVNLDNYLCFLAYAGGFAIGNYLGIRLEEKLAIGIMSIRIITQKDALELTQALRDSGYGVTKIDAEGMTGHVNVLYTLIKRSNLKHVIEMIQKFNPKALYTVENIRSVSEGTFPNHSSWGGINLHTIFPLLRKGK